LRLGLRFRFRINLRIWYVLFGWILRLRGFLGVEIRYRDIRFTNNGMEPELPLPVSLVPLPLIVFRFGRTFFTYPIEFLGLLNKGVNFVLKLRLKYDLPMRRVNSLQNSYTSNLQGLLIFK
jgi:hypothetical protein